MGLIGSYSHGRNTIAHDSMMSALPDLVPRSFLFSSAIAPANTNNLHSEYSSCHIFAWPDSLVDFRMPSPFGSFVSNLLWAVLLVLCPSVLLRVFKLRCYESQLSSLAEVAHCERSENRGSGGRSCRNGPI